ncbi:hypothetical protein, partial [Amycolatopsis sp.]|uniref:hypothetical protein n=1 Tax=Amycolatopsis sp. TaxID=37632 RepID=UPI002D7FAC2C
HDDQQERGGGGTGDHGPRIRPPATGFPVPEGSTRVILEPARVIAGSTRRVARSAGVSSRQSRVSTW